MDRGKIMSLRVVPIIFVYFATIPVNAQPSKMTDEQQEWFYCLVSKNWCVSRSTDKKTGEGKAVAMISANRPAYFHGHISRVTLQVACSEGKPVTMLMTGREISSGDITLHYRISPSGKTGILSAKQTEAGYFFEIKNESFLGDLRDGTKVSVELSFPSEAKPSAVEFDLTGTDAALKRLNCF